MNSLEHRRVFTQAVDQPVVAFETRGRNLYLLVVIGAFVDQHQPHPRRTRALTHELPCLSRTTSGIDAKKISVMMIAETTQY